jgi:F5/8 type C domain
MKFPCNAGRKVAYGVGITCLLFGIGAGVAQTGHRADGTVRVDITPGHVLNSFNPDQALGTSVDALSRRDIDAVYTPHILQESLSAGWGPISYRNNTELRKAAWHWNPNGAWSDPIHQSGYFIGSTQLQAPIRYILAYALPHCGFATGGDHPLPAPDLTYWKSNPYLTSRFTGESDSKHPQWVVVDLRAPQRMNAIRIEWENPYAIQYEVQYWVGTDALDFDAGPKGEWRSFPSGVLHRARGGTATLKPTGAPVTARYVRILMLQSSNTCDEHGSQDIRNCVGYAINEIQVGNVDKAGSFSANAGNAREPTGYVVSSIDPWHSAADVDDNGSYQHTGFDLFFTSGITNNLPAMVPVTMLYGTPEGAAAEIAYIEKRGYPLRYVEMGEEPDGQHMLPEDYAALYLQWATAIHKVDPKLKLGGPVFEGVDKDITVWPDAQGRTSWMGRFVDYLKAHGRISDLAFVSFEHYPYDPCAITWKSLYAEPQLMQHILQVWRNDGVPKNVPLMVTESSLAPQLTGPMSTMFAGLWLGDSVGSFLAGGGALYTHSPIQPQGLQSSCLGWASWSSFVSDKDYDIRGYTSFYYAAQMINREWVLHRSGVHRMFPSSINIRDGAGNVLVTSYALIRPDGEWSLMLVNRDENNSHAVKVEFDNATAGQKLSFRGSVTETTFGSDQYVWIDDGLGSHADPDHAPVASTVSGGARAVFELPTASITVLRGKVKNAPE